MSALAWGLSFLIGVILGLLGGGGSILTTPMLMGVLDVPPREAIAMSLVVVGLTSVAALVPHALAGRVDVRTGLAFGLAGMVGSGLGGYLAGYLPERALMLLFGGMMAATAVAMLRGGAPAAAARPRGGALAIARDGALVGLFTGTVGAGGGFLVVPALVVLRGLPMPKAVGTSLLVIAMNAAAGAVGHLQHTAIAPRLTAGVAVAAALGAVVGSRLSAWVPAEGLRKGFAGFVLVMAGVVIAGQA